MTKRPVTAELWSRYTHERLLSEMCVAGVVQRLLDPNDPKYGCLIWNEEGSLRIDYIERDEAYKK